MKKTILIVLLTAFFSAVFFGCRGNGINAGGAKTEPEGPITWEQIQPYMAPGAEVSSERPYPDVLSEKEALIKFVEYARQIGALQPSFYLYRRNPKLMDLKLEVPILLYGLPYGTTELYHINGVNVDGEPLLEIIVSARVGTSMKEFERARAYADGSGPDEYTSHQMNLPAASRGVLNRIGFA
jgi:hypothetical protein